MIFPFYTQGKQKILFRFHRKETSGYVFFKGCKKGEIG